MNLFLKTCRVTLLVEQQVNSVFLTKPFPYALCPCNLHQLDVLREKTSVILQEQFVPLTMSVKWLAKSFQCCQKSVNKNNIKPICAKNFLFVGSVRLIKIEKHGI